MALNPRCSLSPSCSKRRRITSPASGSSRGNRCSVALTRSTSLPRRRKAWASSQPTGPPPMTTSRGGSSVSANTRSLVRYSPVLRPAMGGGVRGGGGPAGGGRPGPRAGGDPALPEPNGGVAARHEVRRGEAGVAEVALDPRLFHHLHRIARAAEGTHSTDPFHNRAEV